MRHTLRFGIAAAAVFVVAIGALAGFTTSNGRAGTTQQGTRSAVSTLRGPQSTDALIESLQARIARSGDRAQEYSALGAAYLQKARESNDPAYYGKAEGVLRTALRLDPEDSDTLVYLGGLALARHQFSDALALGERARSVKPDKAAVYGVIGDAQVELGRYNEAIVTVQTMEDLRPGLSSYSRASYIRELYGDLPGAIEFMRLAAEAGAPGSEALAWTRTQLGHLYFNSGDLDAAEREYQRTLSERSEYVHARAGLARVAAARGQYPAAAAQYEAITHQAPLAEYVIALADVRRAAGDRDGAAQAEGLVDVIDRLQQANGVNTDAEMALFAADHARDLPAALERARQALADRPSIHSADVLAWTLYQNGRYDEAQTYSAQALRLGTRDSLMRYHAGMIALALGQPERARAFLQDALSLNPRSSLLYAADAERLLRTLTDSAQAVTHP